MKKILLIGFLAAVLGFSGLAHAAFENNGIDLMGNHLIYDTARNITWYDATDVHIPWSAAVNWADNLTVTGSGNTITGWRLPTAYNYDGTGPFFSSSGQIITSEMSHLYNDLNNDPSIRTNYFPNLSTAAYWSSTAYTGTDPAYSPATDYAWAFHFAGIQGLGLKASGSGVHVLAVHDGNVSPYYSAPVPIPGAILLFAPALAGLAAIRRRLQK